MRQLALAVYLFVAGVGLIATGVAKAQTLTASRDATVPTTVRVAWDVPGAVSCVGSGTTGWTGARTPSGTRTLTSVGLNITLNLSLDCIGPAGNGSLRLTWLPPTTNTDGSTLTNLGGYRIHYSMDVETLHQTLDLAVPGASAYELTDLPPGTYFAALSALTDQCFATPTPVTCRVSAQSNIASKVVAGSPGAALPKLTVQVLPFPTPSPPTNVLIADAQAYEIKTGSTGTLTASRIGLVKPGTPCEGETRTVGTVTYTQVPREAVDVVNFSTTGKTFIPVVYARCG